MLSKNNKVKIHFIGVGGIGMSALAQILLQFGYPVSGSDVANSQNVKKLKELGAEIYIGHSSENLKNVDVVVFSSAINEENPEIIEARRSSIPIMKRAGLLSDIMKLKYGIAVAGTHGKTTTSSILSTILEESGHDISFILGGIVKNLNGHAKVGKGDFLVAEADESDGSFLLLNPLYSIITNIDSDHLDYYKTEENLENAFLEFANRIPFYGVCCLNGNDEKLFSLHKKMRRPFITFGISESDKKFNYEARSIEYESFSTKFNLFHDNVSLGEFKTPTVGEHNVKNSLAAISIAHQIGLSIDDIQKSILSFEGVGRRFQLLYSNQKLEIIDDYAHHPTEVFEVIKAVKETRKNKEILVVFEPHRFTRTRDCWTDFLNCFTQADNLFVLPIYKASEKPILGIDSKILVKDINQLHPNFAEFINDSELHSFVKSRQNKEATILFLGAGSVSSLAKNVVEQL